MFSYLFSTSEFAGCWSAYQVNHGSSEFGGWGGEGLSPVERTPGTWERFIFRKVIFIFPTHNIIYKDKDSQVLEGPKSNWNSDMVGIESWAWKKLKSYNIITHFIAHVPRTVGTFSERSKFTWATPHWLLKVQCFSYREVILGNMLTCLSVKKSWVSKYIFHYTLVWVELLLL